jgi:hypothetical protein
MVWSFVYPAVRKVLALIVLVGRSDRSKELEILVPGSAPDRTARHNLGGQRRCTRRSPPLTVSWAACNVGADITPYCSVPP